MSIDEESLQKIIDGVTSKIKSELKVGSSEPVKEEPKSAGPNFSPDDLIAKLIPELGKHFSEQTTSQIRSIKEESFKEKLEQKLNENPYFKNFLEDEDDYGKKRVDYINSIEDIGDRAEVLSKIEARFKQAMASNGESNVTIKNMIKDEVTKHENVYSDLDKKLDSKEISNNEYTDMFVESIIKEMDSMSRL